jgi:hypothetical protein
MMLAGGYKWVLTAINMDSGLSFDYAVTDENTQSVTEEPEQDIL